MAKYRGPVCKICRREGLKLFIKGERCYTDKCAFERRAYAPGQHGLKPVKYSDYGIQLREKQKVKKMCGMLEGQFKRTFFKAAKTKGITGENLLCLLERRLDNVVYRSGFAGSRMQARQLVSHGHMLVNGKKAKIPSMITKTGDRVSVKDKSKKVNVIKESFENVEKRGVPKWLEVDKANFSTVLTSLPTRDDITIPIKEQLIVELYSK